MFFSTPQIIRRTYPFGVKSFCRSAWQGLRSGAVKPDSSNGTNGVRRIARYDTADFHRSCRAVIQLHSVLACRIEPRGGDPWLIQSHAEPIVEDYDFSRLPHAAAEVAAAAQLARTIWSPIDVVAGPLCRFVLVRVSEVEAYIGCVLSHFIADGMSVDIVLDAICGLYQGNRSKALQSAPARYEDFLAAMDNWMSDRVGQAALARAADRVSDMPAIDFSSLAIEGGSFFEPFDFGAYLAADVRDLAKRHKTSTFVVILAALMTLSSSFCQGRCVPVRVITTGRDLPSLNGSVGNYADRLYVLAEVTEKSLLGDAIAITRAAFTDALRHALVRDEYLQQELLRRDIPRGAPVLNFQRLSSGRRTAEAEIRSLNLTAPAAEPTRPKAAFQLSMFDDDINLWGHVRYGPVCLDGIPARLERILAGFCGRELDSRSEPSEPILAKGRAISIGGMDVL